MTFTAAGTAMARVKLVRVTREHADPLFSVLSDPALYTFTGGEPPRSAAALGEWFSLLETGLSPDGSEQWLTWVVQLQECATPIGYVQATVRGTEAEISWLIGSRWQGNGYAQEAMTALLELLGKSPVEEVVAHINPRHKVSQQIARRLALQPTGCHADGEESWRGRIR